MRKYSGYKDSKENKICEGDIVKVSNKIKASYRGEIGVIEFYANNWCIDMSLRYPLMKEGWCEKIKSCDTKYFEVIGNISNNKDLLIRR